MNPFPLSNLLCRTACLLGLVLAAGPLTAQQTAEAQADSLMRIAIRLMDGGQSDSAIWYLGQAKALYPEKLTYEYETGLALYMKEDYQAALTIFNKLCKHKAAEDLYFKMLGNTYDLLGQREKARKAYQRGLKKFPDSGPLYLEMGVIEMLDKRYDQALDYWEKGIAVDPTHASNYYWAAKLYAGSDEKVWALIYAELFLNLEFNTKRSREISKLLYDTYGQVYEPTSDSTGVTHLTQKGMMLVLDDLQKALKQAKKGTKVQLLPFEGAYAMTFSLAAVPFYQDTVSLERLHQLRSRFIELWYDEEKPYSQAYTHALFDYHRSMMAQGFFDCYNYLLLHQGDLETFQAFYEKNEARFEGFLQWYNTHDIDFDSAPSCRLHYE